jgi:predicted nucleic acid-binding protein
MVFVRIVNSQSYPNRQPSIWYTLGLLSKAKDEFTNYYEFWPDEVSLTDQNIFRHKFIIGHKMITDVYLLGLCKKRGGKLATFDGRVSPDLIEGGSAELVELIG